MPVWAEPPGLRPFLDRFCRLAPGRKITFQPGAGACPPGFSLVVYRLTAAAPDFEEASAVLVSEDLGSVFTGHALSLGSSPVDPADPGAREALSRHLSQKAGASLAVRWSGQPGPGGAYPGTLTQPSPWGPLESECALSRDGRWVLFGTFFPLAADPRRERMRRLALENHPSRGPEGALLTLVELTDLQCPSCAELQPVLDATLARHPGQIRLVHVDLPQWKAHDWTLAAAERARCAELLLPGAYWRLAGAVFSMQRDLTAKSLDERLRPVLRELDLSPESLRGCLAEGRGRRAVLQDMRRAADLGLRATPTLLVDGSLLDHGIAQVLEEAVTLALQARIQQSDSPAASSPR